MAFSYSDENFTVIGNLCFGHISVSDKNAQYEIPPAIADRMLDKNITFCIGHTRKFLIVVILL